VAALEGRTAAALAQVASAMPEADGIVPGWVQPALRTLSAVGDDDARRRLALALALSGTNEDAPAPQTPAPAPQNPTISSSTVPLNTVSTTANTSPSLPSSVLFQFMQGVTPTAEGSPDWLLPPPRVPAPTPPRRPTVPTP
jgi:hypothetical protein